MLKACSVVVGNWRCHNPAQIRPDGSPNGKTCWTHVEHKSKYGEYRIIKKTRRTGDVLIRNEMGQKLCPSCDEWKSEDDFYKAKHTSDGVQPHCRECYLWGNTLRNFGLTRIQYEKILADQGGKCATCGTATNRGGRFSVDHDHSCCPESGKSCGKCIRGLLCSNCNTALGMIADSGSTLSAMVGYLKKWEESK